MEHCNSKSPEEMIEELRKQLAIRDEQIAIRDEQGKFWRQAAFSAQTTTTSYRKVCTACLEEGKIYTWSNVPFANTSMYEMTSVVAPKVEAALYATASRRLSKYFYPALHTHMQTSRRDEGQRYPDLYLSTEKRKFSSHRQGDVFKHSTFLVEQERSFGVKFESKLRQQKFPVISQAVDVALAKKLWPSSHLASGLGQVCEWLCNRMEQRSNHPICFVTDLNWWVFVTSEMVQGNICLKVSKAYTFTEAGHVLTALASQAASGMYTPIPRDEGSSTIEEKAEPSATPRIPGVTINSRHANQPPPPNIITAVNLLFPK